MDDAYFRVYGYDSQGRERSIWAASRDAMPQEDLPRNEWRIFLGLELALLVALESGTRFEIVRVVEVGPDVIVAEIRAGRVTFPPDLVEQGKRLSLVKMAENLRLSMEENGLLPGTG